MKWTGFWIDGDKAIEEHTQDVEPILERNKRLRNEGRGFSESGDLKRIASIPLVVVHQWLQEGVDVFNPDHTKEVERRLNSSDWAFLRTSEGNV